MVAVSLARSLRFTAWNFSKSCPVNLTRTSQTRSGLEAICNTE